MEPGFNLEGFIWSIGVWAVLYMLPAFVASSIPFFINMAIKKTKFDFIDSMMLILPYLFWAICMNMDPSRKDIGNLIEPVILGGSLVFGFFARIFLCEKIKVRKLQIILLTGYSLLALVIFFSFAKIGEV